jgi:adenylate cyclase
MPAPKLLGELIPCGGGDPIPLLKPKLLVGRRSHCDIQLQFPNVSSHHCELEHINGFWRVQDLGSSNGIKINGERLESKWLMPGDVIAIAKHRYEVHYTPPDGQRPPEDQEDVFSRSLLDKAGLQRTHEAAPPRRSPANSTPPSESPAAPPSKRGSADDDEAMRWLSEL